MQACVFQAHVLFLGSEVGFRIAYSFCLCISEFVMHFADGRSPVFTGLHWDGKQTSSSSLRPTRVRTSIPGWLLRRWALSLRIDRIGCSQARASLLFSKHF